MKRLKRLAYLAIPVFIYVALTAYQRKGISPVIDQEKFARHYYQEDYQWYLDNIPFFECSDKQIEEVYYYRWKLYKAHIRNVGTNKYVITEFINHVAWDRDPYCTINAASMHHIYEGRWLRDSRFVDGYINYLCRESGNNRHYSESIGDAAYANYLVNGDKDFITAQLDSLKNTYDQWSDHWDSSRNLYYIPAMPDATEYTIASIDASGGKDGFDDGEAFRPTINSYMYGNAIAIAKIAALKGDMKTSRDYLQRANHIKQNLQQNIWNDSLQHFTDRFKVNNEYVKNWNFIRGRELAGYAPWYFNLPDDNSTYNAAWKHLTDTSQLLGQYGFRTNEPSYEYYFKQFVYFQGQRGSQWNGPSWPYQNSQALTAMANFLNNYKQDVISNSDYLKCLRLFTKQHYLPNGKINLVEDYDPNLGGPIVYYYWSNHYLHSSFNNLVISGLCGIRPSESDELDIHPLIDSSITYFCLSNLKYHGHNLTFVYDRDGTKYKLGKGLFAFVDGNKTAVNGQQEKYKVRIGSTKQNSSINNAPNYALNISRDKYPAISASVNSVPDSLFQAVDGRIWYFPEITNFWSTAGSSSKSDWLQIDFGQPRKISLIKIYPFTDSVRFHLPGSIQLEYKQNGKWLPLKTKKQTPSNVIANTENTWQFDPVQTAAMRVNIKHAAGQAAISEVACY